MRRARGLPYQDGSSAPHIASAARGWTRNCFARATHQTADRNVNHGPRYSLQQKASLSESPDRTARRRIPSSLLLSICGEVRCAVHAGSCSHRSPQCVPILDVARAELDKQSTTQAAMPELYQESVPLICNNVCIKNICACTIEWIDACWWWWKNVHMDYSVPELSTCIVRQCCLCYLNIVIKLN